MNTLFESPKDQYKKILTLDESIRFVGRIQDRRVIAFVRRNDAEPLLGEEMENMAHYQASLKAGMEEMFDDSWKNKLDDYLKRSCKDNNIIFR